MKDLIKVSQLGKVWVLDLDGTIVKHNGYKIDGYDSLLENIEKLFSQISDKDMVLFITSRSEKEKGITEDFLKKNNIRYDYIIYNAPYGERILINDTKPSGLCMAYGIATKRNKVCDIKFQVDNSL